MFYSLKHLLHIQTGHWLADDFSKRFTNIVLYSSFEYFRNTSH